MRTSQYVRTAASTDGSQAPHFKTLTRFHIVDYCQVRDENDLFSDASALDTLGLYKKEGVEAGIRHKLNVSALNGLPISEQGTLEEQVRSHGDIFRTSFSSGPPARVCSLRVELTPLVEPVRVYLRHYSQEQKELLSDFFSQSVEAGMACFNATSAWYCAPLPVSKPGPSKYLVTVELQSVNRFTVKPQFPMPNLEQ